MPESKEPRASRNEVAALAAALTVAGMFAQARDTNTTGLDDNLGRRMSLAGSVLAQMTAGETPGNTSRAADALDAVAAVLQAEAAELRSRSTGR